MLALHLGLLLASAAAQSHLWSEVAAPLPHVPVFLRFKKSGTGAAENELFHRVCVAKDAVWTGNWQFDEERMPGLYGFNSEFNRERTNISRATRATANRAVWIPNLQPDFNVSVFECFDTSSLTGLRELDKSDRSV